MTFYYDHAHALGHQRRPGPDHHGAGLVPERARLPGRLDARPACGRGCRTPTATAPTPGPPTEIPAGSYEVKVAHGLSWDENYGAGGARTAPTSRSSVPADGTVVTFSLRPGDPRAHRRRPRAAGSAPDLDARPRRTGCAATSSRGRRRRPDGTDPDAATLAAALVADRRPGGRRRGRHRRLDRAAAATTRPGCLPTSLADYPAARGLPGPAAVPHHRRRRAEDPARPAGRRDVRRPSGRLHDATGVQVPGVLDDLYAARGRARPTASTGRPARRRSRCGRRPRRPSPLLVVRPAGPCRQRIRVPMRRGADGAWTVTGHRRVEGRQLPVRGRRSTRPTDGQGRDQPRHRPVLGGADA